MKILSAGSTLMLACLAFPGAALAGEVRDFEAAMRAAYADYRAALFLTNADQQEKAQKKLESFEQKWAVLAGRANAPPPQYEDDPYFAETLSSVAAIANEANRSIDAGKLGEAHEKLEGIREEFAKLHERNGVVTFSDHMNAYHAQMEVVLKQNYGGLDASGIVKLREDLAILAYLADQVARHNPPEAADAEYGPLLAAFNTSVANLVTAAQSGDAAGIKAAKAGLKPAYAKLFLKFG